jgi:DNA-binding response OmpR family regulator
MVKKILLIEDDEFIRDLYKRQLDMGGFFTHAFPNGNEGLKSLKENNYDLILLDVMLPGINGLDILRNVKQNDETKNIPVIMLSNVGQDDVIKEGLVVGAVGYLIKSSFTPSQVVGEVKKILEQQTEPQSSAS